MKVVDLDIASGGPLVVVVNYKDAQDLGLHHGDRIGINRGRFHAHAIVDIAESSRTVKSGSIGLFEEVIDKLKARNGSDVNIKIERKPESLVYIKKKLDGYDLNNREMKAIMEDLVHGKLSPVELSFFVGASYTYGLTEKETVGLTKAMIETGETLSFPSQIVVDKHCTGGVAGNRTTPIIVPILAAAGLKVPKTSSRAITSPAGTADTMEVLANVDIPIKKMKKIVNSIHGCIVWGGAINLAPADDMIIQVEHPLSIDAEGQLLASILAKKGSVGSTHILIDIPLGKETKIKTEKEAKHLALKFKRIGKKLGMKIEVILTDGNQPIGNGIGPALEAKDVLKVLQRSDTRPFDLEEKSVMMAGKIFEMSGKSKKGQGIKLAQKILDSKDALKKMEEIIVAQGGKLVHSSDIGVGKLTYDVVAAKSGKVYDVSNSSIARIAKFAGAPRDAGSGIYLHVHEKQVVKKGEILFTIHAQSKDKLKFARKLADESVPIRIK